jgi:hypothetical protein
MDADAAAYEAMSYRELQQEAKQRGVKAAGKRDELLARLLEHYQQQGWVGRWDAVCVSRVACGRDWDDQPIEGGIIKNGLTLSTTPHQSSIHVPLTHQL